MEYRVQTMEYRAYVTHRVRIFTGRAHLPGTPWHAPSLPSFRIPLSPAGVSPTLPTCALPPASVRAHFAPGARRGRPRRWPGPQETVDHKQHHQQHHRQHQTLVVWGGASKPFIPQRRDPSDAEAFEWAGDSAAVARRKTSTEYFYIGDEAPTSAAAKAHETWVSTLGPVVPCPD